MSRCDECGKQENMPYHCRHCGGTFCSDHRLPENHDCPGLESWGDPDGVFDSGFDDSVDNSSSSGASAESVTARLGINTGPGSVLGYFRGNMTYVFLGLMWITFLIQMVLRATGQFGLERFLFVLTVQNPEFVWTWFTSIFSHGDFFHIAFNSIIIFFFGRIVEEYVGSRDFALIFLGSGAIAGLAQVGWVMLQGATVGGVLGASGAALAIGGVLVILNPNLQILIWGILPVPMWALVGFIVVRNVFGLFGAGSGGIAYTAHLIGLAIGLTYGLYVKDKVSTPNRMSFGPGGPGGPGGRGRGPF